ncbi:DUF4856 domain-containing protein [Hyunsoonleella sp. SJ7]|uniref:DUF4856 domain-containing protein n=1 Tax=Hyunsoonleella aquatilis TaxID=2762758 RepID=A0A923KI31_9FLAO|nr:DUF4856 domain-containing protein [Hyunsoonleella aquatilis]MBC3757809.1 DUF4856 domain-containing protein [Hyunsoonleella aquatilis]
MKKLLIALIVSSTFFQSCDNEDDVTGPDTVNAPATYDFTRNGNSTVDFNGQTTRLLMGEEFITGLMDPAKTETQLDGMFTNVGGYFSDSDLNDSSKSIRSKTAASADFFSANTTDANAIKAEFDSWIKAQVDEVFPNWNVDATEGVAGKLQEGGGSTTRYINAKGLEYNQAINKGLIGALTVDQALNNYLSTTVLDAGTNIADNDTDTVADGKSYTNMEHKWDEAYGYVFGLNANPAKPNDDLGADSFLNKYIGRVENDPDFAGIADDIYQAFKLGRAAIVAKNYTIRDEQAEIIKEKISEIIGIRAVYYLQQGKLNLGSDNAVAFHDLSEGFGFIYSLQFTRKPGANAPYFIKAEVDGFIATLTAGNGFWDITAEALDTMSDTIASKFNFTVAEAASSN